MVKEQIPFGEQLAEYLKTEGITVEHFCVRVFEATEGLTQISANSVHGWIAGNSIPREGTQRGIAKAMGVDVADLFGSQD